MSRAKKGAACEGKVPASQEEAAMDLPSVGQLRPYVCGTLGEDSLTYTGEQEIK